MGGWVDVSIVPGTRYQVPVTRCKEPVEPRGVIYVGHIPDGFFEPPYTIYTIYTIYTMYTIYTIYTIHTYILIILGFFVFLNFDKIL